MISTFARSCAPGDALFILASEDAVSSSRFTTAFAIELIHLAKLEALTFPNKRHEPPLTVNVDELVNTVRMRKFPNLLADSGGRGISVRWVAQGRAFLSAVWGEVGAGAILTNSTWKIVMRKLHDAAYLRDLEQLAGTYPRSADDGLSQRDVPVLPMADIENQKEMTAVILAPLLRPFRAQLVDIGADSTPRVTPDARPPRTPAPPPAAHRVNTTQRREVSAGPGTDPGSSHHHRTGHTTCPQL